MWEEFNLIIDFMSDIWSMPLNAGGITFTLWQVATTVICVSIASCLLGSALGRND